MLGSFDRTMTYPKSLYYSAKAYGSGYLPGGLYVEPDGWNDEINHWLASLQGLSYERIVPRPSGDSDKDWKNFIDRIWGYLKEGSPVQILRGWSRRVREEKGKLFSPSGKRMFWWEGMRKTVRPDMHYATAVGMDKAKGILYVNDPIAGWFGVKKNLEMDLKWLRGRMEADRKSSSGRKGNRKTAQSPQDKEDKGGPVGLRQT